MRHVLFDQRAMQRCRLATRLPSSCVLALQVCDSGCVPSQMAARQVPCSPCCGRRRCGGGVRSCSRPHILSMQARCNQLLTSCHCAQGSVLRLLRSLRNIKHSAETLRCVAWAVRPRSTSAPPTCEVYLLTFAHKAAAQPALRLLATQLLQARVCFCYQQTLTTRYPDHSHSTQTPPRLAPVAWKSCLYACCR